MAYTWECPTPQAEVDWQVCETGHVSRPAAQAVAPEPEQAGIQADCWPQLPPVVQDGWVRLHSRVSAEAG